MTTPDTPDTFPAAFDVFVGPVGTPLPDGAADTLDAGLTLVGQVDGKTLYDNAGRVNPFPVVWTSGPNAPFAYDIAYAVVCQAPYDGAEMRVRLADVTFSEDSSGNVTGSAVGDADGFAAYWFYGPPAV